MKAFALAICIAMSGFGCSTITPVVQTKQEQTVDIDPALLEDFDDLPLLASGSDVDILEHQKAVYTQYFYNREIHRALVRIVKQAFNIKD